MRQQATATALEFTIAQIRSGSIRIRGKQSKKVVLARLEARLEHARGKRLNRPSASIAARQAAERERMQAVVARKERP